MVSSLFIFSCKDDDDDDGLSGDLQALQGLWADENNEESLYITGNKCYVAGKVDGAWYYRDKFPVNVNNLDGEWVDVGMTISASDKKFTLKGAGGQASGSYEITGDTLTLNVEDYGTDAGIPIDFENCKYKKVSEKPKPASSLPKEKLKELLDA